MKVSGDWLTRSSTQTVCAMLTDAGHQALLVGGCVRNALLGVDVADIDISTDALPDQVIELAQKAGLKAIPTGKDHGTITVVAEGLPHEITTFRKDIETDGRRAVVSFSKHVEDDAHRRDFTMNALYVARDGTLVDPLGGLTDLKARRFVFIDDADMRIREDYLRILRFFRFNAWYGDPAAGLDPEALAAISANSAGIETLSKERVGSEMVKLLSAPDPAPAVAAMRQSGVLSQVIAGADDKALAPLVHFEGLLKVGPDPMRRLAVLGGGDTVAKELRLSKKQVALLGRLKRSVTELQSPPEYAYRQGAAEAVSAALIKSALFEQPLPEGLIADIGKAATARFPVTAADLIDTYQGKALGDKMRQLEQAWIASGFRLNREDLLNL